MTLAKLKQVGAKHRRKVIIITGIALVLLAVAAYTLWSMNTWNSYKTSYENWQKDLRTNVDTTIALPVASVPERAKKMTAFKDISSNIRSAQQSLCSTPALITWQHAIDSLRKNEEACGRIIRNAESFGQKMQATTTYLEKEQALAAAIAAAFAVSKDKVTEATWASQLTTWQDAGKNIAKIASTEVSFTKVKMSAAEKVKAVESAWQELIAAHTAKNKVAYLESQSKLTAAYGNLLSLSTESAEQLAAFAAPLQVAYSQAFGK